MRFVINNYTTQRRDRTFTISKCIKCINSLVGRNPVGQVNNNFNTCSSIILNFFYFDFTLIIGLKDVINKTGSGCSKRYFTNNECVFIQLIDLGPHPDFTPPISIIVSLNINDTSSLKIRI